MKKYLATGLIILLPIGLTLYLVLWLFDLLTQPFVGIVERFILAYESVRGINLAHHEMLVTLLSRVIVLVVLLIVIFLLGLLGRRLFFNQMVSLSQNIFTKIPIIKTIYGLTSEVTKAFLKPDQRTFKETVLIPFPNNDTHALGLVTGEAPAALRKVIGDAELSVFVPTAPHPISGYILIAPRKQLIPVDITTEETFRFLLSCGVAVPEEKNS